MDDVLAKRNVKFKVLETFEGTTEEIDRFITQGEGERPWESFELTQGQDVREWIKNPDRIEGIQENLHHLIGKLNMIQYFNILDVGCYGGYLYDYLKRKLSHFNYIGLDVNQKVIEAAKKAHKNCYNAAFIQGDIFNLPEQLGSIKFDIVCCYRVLIHLPYFEQCLLNLINLTNNIVHVALTLSDRDMCERVMETNLETNKKAFYFRRYFSMQMIEDTLNKCPVKYSFEKHSDSRYASLFIYK